MVQHLLSLYRASILTAEGGAEALEARDLAGYKDLEAKQQAISSRWQGFAKNNGFKVCGLEKGRDCRGE
jgi:hypothetical protein